jgi:spoIIIJ-associated protein
MEWVETTGSTVEDAKEAALDELGVDEADAEFEVISEARAGLFGRLRSEARVRARVRPTAPRAKEDRRDRRRRASSNKEAGPSSSVMVEPVATTAEGSTSANGDDVPGAATGALSSVPPASQADSGEASTRATSRRRRNRRPASQGRDEQAGSEPGKDQDRIDNEEREGADVEVDLEEQGKVAAEFLTQLTAEFGLNASVSISKQDEDTLDVQMTGSDLGLLIGPKGATLLAIQNLARTIVHYETGANNGHINVDVGGYRQKRTEALVRFAHEVAAKVKQSGTRTALEPMSAVDRKIVHDAVSDMEGVATVSEGEEPRRRVVVIPSPTSS